jgi:ferredoxin-thioredoxin reductase catalytic chain
MTDPTPQVPLDVDRLTARLDKDAEAAGYHLNPDMDVTKPLVDGLIVNEGRYGYRSCPCRLASGDADDDLDIVCPCDYRDPDVEEYGACYCGLYVSQDVKDGNKVIGSIPERRPAPEQRRKQKTTATGTVNLTKLSQPVWRCRVCGYLCARQGPPGVCPICKAKKERFERFM